MAQERLILAEEQLQALKRATQEKEVNDEIEKEHPGYLVSFSNMLIHNLAPSP
jgi:hypothetical protein